MPKKIASNTVVNFQFNMRYKVSGGHYVKTNIIPTVISRNYFTAGYLSRLEQFALIKLPVFIPVLS